MYSFAVVNSATVSQRRSACHFGVHLLSTQRRGKRRFSSFASSLKLRRHRNTQLYSTSWNSSVAVASFCALQWSVFDTVSGQVTVLSAVFSITQLDIVQTALFSCLVSSITASWPSASMVSFSAYLKKRQPTHSLTAYKWSAFSTYSLVISITAVSLQQADTRRSVAASRIAPAASSVSALGAQHSQQQQCQQRTTRQLTALQLKSLTQLFNELDMLDFAVKCLRVGVANA